MPATVDIVTPNLVVNPGEAVSTQLRLTNTGRVVDEITVEILGDAGPFASVDPAALPLFPGAHGVVTVTFRPPRGTSPVAGIVPVGFRVRSREDPAFSYVAEARLEIGAVLDVRARLSPRNSVAGRIGQGARHRVELENAGNSVARVTIAAGDPDDRLSFRIATPVVSVPPGGRTNVTISVGTRDRMWTGAPATRPFQVVANPDGAQPITLDGSLQQRPAIFVGTSQILTVAVVVGVAGLLASQLLPALVASPSSTPSPSAAAATGPSGGLATAGSSLSRTRLRRARADASAVGARRIDDGAGRLDGRAEHGDHRSGDGLADPDAGPILCSADGHSDHQSRPDRSPRPADARDAAPGADARDHPGPGEQLQAATPVLVPDRDRLAAGGGRTGQNGGG